MWSQISGIFLCSSCLDCRITGLQLQNTGNFKHTLALNTFLHHLLIKLVNDLTDQLFTHQSAVVILWTDVYFPTHVFFFFFCILPQQLVWNQALEWKRKMSIRGNCEKLLQAESCMWMLNELFMLAQVSLCWQHSSSSAVAVLIIRVAANVLCNPYWARFQPSDSYAECQTCFMCFWTALEPFLTHCVDVKTSFASGTCNTAWSSVC